MHNLQNYISKFLKYYQGFLYYRKAINLKTLYFNLKNFPLQIALKLPIIISNKCLINNSSGMIKINGNITTGMIKIGFGNVGIFDRKRSRSILQNSGTIIFNGKANIGHGSKINVESTGVLEFGDNFIMVAESSIIVTKRVAFGNNCLISWNNLFMDTDFHRIVDENDMIINNPQEISIGSFVWIGCRCTILKGANIKDGSVIGANSVISNNLDSTNSVYVGNPPKCIKKNITWQM